MKPRHPSRKKIQAKCLARQLITYKRFKEIALFLRQRETQGLRTFLRMAPMPKIPGKLRTGGFSTIGFGTSLYTYPQFIIPNSSPQ